MVTKSRYVTPVYRGQGLGRRRRRNRRIIFILIAVLIILYFCFSAYSRKDDIKKTIQNHFRAENSEHNYISLSVSNHSRKHIVKVKSALKECAAATILISVKGNSDAQITIENDHGFNGNITAYYSNGG